MASTKELIVILTPEQLQDITVRVVARTRARRIVLEVLEDHARRGGPGGRAALAELDHRAPDVARRIRDRREWLIHARMSVYARAGVRTPAEFRVLASPA